MTHDSGTTEGEDGADRFVDLLEWLISLNGDIAGITKVISSDTLRKWRDGRYPKHRSTGAVAAVDRWARRTYPGVYPPDWAQGGLIALAGPGQARTLPSAPTAATSDSRNADSASPEKIRQIATVAGFTAITVLIALIVTTLLISSRHSNGLSTLYARGGGPVAIHSCPDRKITTSARPRDHGWGMTAWPRGGGA